MSRSKSIQRYPHCQVWWQKIFESKDDNAILGRHENWTKAERDNFAGEMGWYRYLHRHAIFPKDHPSYGTSVYDPYKILRVTEKPSGKFVIHVKRINSALINIKIDFA